jgi:LacI family transcriptional regulator
VSALGYERNTLAQSLRTGETFSVGLVAIDVANPILAANASGAEQVLQAAGYSLLISNSQGNPALDAAYIRHFDSRRVDGLLLSLADETYAETLDLLRGLVQPVVLIDRSLPPDIEVAAVMQDHGAGTAQAARHLLTLGHRRFALVNGALHVRPSRVRAASLRRAVRGAAGTTCVVRGGAYTDEHGYSATLALMRADPVPTAIFVGGNQIITGVMRALREVGAAVPGDVSLVVYDSPPLAEFMTPPLSTIVRDPTEVGREAGRLLLEQLAGAPPRIVALPTEFRPTRSCGRPPKSSLSGR